MLCLVVQCVNAHAHAVEKLDAAACDFTQRITIRIIYQVLWFAGMGQ